MKRHKLNIDRAIFALFGNFICKAPFLSFDICEFSIRLCGAFPVSSECNPNSHSSCTEDIWFENHTKALNTYCERNRCFDMAESRLLVVSSVAWRANSSVQRKMRTRHSMLKPRPNYKHTFAWCNSAVTQSACALCCVRRDLMWWRQSGCPETFCLWPAHWHGPGLWTHTWLQSDEEHSPSYVSCNPLLWSLRSSKWRRFSNRLRAGSSTSGREQHFLFYKWYFFTACIGC
jgi:hypothetical protein